MSEEFQTFNILPLDFLNWNLLADINFYPPQCKLLQYSTFIFASWSHAPFFLLFQYNENLNDLRCRFADSLRCLQFHFHFHCSLFTFTPLFFQATQFWRAHLFPFLILCVIGCADTLAGVFQQKFKVPSFHYFGFLL